MKRRKAMKEIRFGNQKDLVFSTMMDRFEFFEKQITPIEDANGNLKELDRTRRQKDILEALDKKS